MTCAFINYDDICNTSQYRQTNSLRHFSASLSTDQIFRCKQRGLRGTTCLSPTMIDSRRMRCVDRGAICRIQQCFCVLIGSGHYYDNRNSLVSGYLSGSGFYTLLGLLWTVLKMFRIVLLTQTHRRYNL